MSDIVKFAELLLLISIPGMCVFTGLKKYNIARWFYLLFSISILPLIPHLLETLDSKAAIIFPVLFSITGVGMFIFMTIARMDKK